MRDTAPDRTRRAGPFGRSWRRRRSCLTRSPPAPRCARVKIEETIPAAVDIGVNDARDEIAGNDEEHIDAKKAALCDALQTEMKRDDGQNRQCPQPVDVRSVFYRMAAEAAVTAVRPPRRAQFQSPYTSSLNCLAADL